MSSSLYVQISLLIFRWQICKVKKFHISNFYIVNKMSKSSCFSDKSPQFSCKRFYVFPKLIIQILKYRWASILNFKKFFSLEYWNVRNQHNSIFLFNTVNKKSIYSNFSDKSKFFNCEQFNIFPEYNTLFQK